MINITLAAQNQLDDIITLIQSVVLEMQKQDLDQWNASYPGRDVIENDIAKKSLYLLTEQEKLAGMVVLNNYQDPEYRTVAWQIPAENVMVIHRLCIHPDFRGKGLAGQLMDFSEKYAKTHGFDVIRLDAYSANPSAMNLYHHRDYQIAGQVYFQGRQYPFNCFEKKIKEKNHVRIEQ